MQDFWRNIILMLYVCWQQNCRFGKITSFMPFLLLSGKFPHVHKKCRAAVYRTWAARSVKRPLQRLNITCSVSGLQLICKLQLAISKTSVSQNPHSPAAERRWQTVCTVSVDSRTNWYLGQRVRKQQSLVSPSSASTAADYCTTLVPWKTHDALHERS